MTNRYSPDAVRGRHFSQILRGLSVSAIVVAGSTSFAQSESPPSETSPTAESAAREETPLPEPSALLKTARETLTGYRTITAKIVESADFGPRRFKAEGDYLQGVDHRVRVDVEVAIGENTGRLLQVSEGDVLWTVYDVGGKLRITRRDVNQILAAAGSDAARATELTELGLGGLPALLASIDNTMTFQPTQTATIEGRTFYVLQGEWKPAIRQQFQHMAQQLPVPTTEPRPLPPHVPDLARIYLDAETYFPYRIRYLKQPQAAPGVDPAAILTLDFRDIVVNESIDPSEFQYTPPAEAEVADITSYYLQKIKAATPAAPAPNTPPQ